VSGDDDLPVAVVRVGADGRVTSANDLAGALLGRPADDLAGTPAAEVLGPAWDAGGPGGHEVDAPAGRLHVATREAADGTAVVAVRPGGSPGMEVVSTVSHELRSPLTSVKGYTSLLLHRWDRVPDDQKRLMLEQVHHDADRVTRLVGELLDISRLETGRLVLRRQMVDLEALARSVVDTVAMAYPDLRGEVDVGDDVPSVYADPDKLEQVLTNLVENAAKYGDPVGVRVVGRAHDGRVSVAVSDRGPGIAPEDLPRVFTKFFRREHGRPTGTGLGLWISRGLVEAHGGHLTVASKPGEGATFCFTLPATSFEDVHPR
jgi:signal transduction histidine kinase